MSAAEHLGEYVMPFIQAKVYKNKILYIDASNSSAAQALFLKQFEILKEMNSHKGKNVGKFVIKTVNK
jgi:hypothetical protein